MRLQVIKNWIFYWCKKIFLYTFFIFISVTTLSFLVLQFAPVQTYLIHRYLSGFSNVIGFSTTVESMDLSWFDRLDMKNVTITDPEKNTMIAVGTLKVNFELFSLLKNGKINIDAVSINQANVNLKEITASDTSESLNVNVFIKRINEQYASGGGGKAGSAKLNIGEIELDHSTFIYNQSSSDSIKNGFDYKHFQLGLNNGNFTAFQVIGDTIQFNVNSLQAQDLQTKFTLHELSTYFRISQRSMEFLNVHLKAGKSTISDTVIFTYQNQNELADFNNNVNILAKLKNTVLDPHDLKLFTYGLPQFPQSVALSGAITGKVSRFVFNPMTIAMGQTKVHGTLSLDGLPNINETFIKLKIKDGIVEQPDIEFLLSESTHNALKPLGRTQTNAEFTGFVNDFVARGNLLTQLGNITTDVNLKIKKGDENLSEFNGNLTLKNFNLGMYLKDTVNYQNVTLDGHINGKGLSRATSDFILTGKINSLGFRKYNYSNITTNAQFAHQLFNGQIAIDDPNLRFNANAFIDFRKGKELIQVKANLDSALLHKLQFSKESLFIQSNFDININGLNLDSLQGKMLLKNTVIQYKTKQLKLDSIDITNERNGLQRELKLRSSIVDISLTGDYRISSLVADAKNWGLNLYEKIVRPTQMTYDPLTNPKIKPYDATLNLIVHNVAPLSQLANLDFYLSPRSSAKINFSRHEKISISAFAQSDTLTYNRKKFLGNTITVNGYRHSDSSDVHAQATLTSAHQKIASFFKTKNLLATTSWDNNLIKNEFNVDQDGNTNQLRLKSTLELMKDSLRVKILPSTLSIFDESWVFNPENFILIKDREWQFHRLGLAHAKESVSLNGHISADSSHVLTLAIDQLGLDVLNTFLQEKIAGQVQGEIQLRNFYHDPFIQSKVSIQKLMVQDFLVGDVTGINQWDGDQERFNVNFYLDRGGKRTVDMQGYYNLANESPLQLTAKLDNTNIKIIEPFMRGIFSNMNGALTGNYSITGTFLEPKINGEGKIQSGSLVFDYLKTKYNFSGLLNFTPDAITFKDFSLVDELNNKGKLNGTISHRYFNNILLNLNASFEKFQVMNTSSKDNGLFYGQAYSTGNLKIHGPIRNLTISATATSDKGTRIFIPLNGSVDNAVAKKEFISFANFTDTLQRVGAKPKVKKEATGITLELNLDITPDAYSEIIFDIRSGDIIRGYGNGSLKLQFDTKGEFSMYGDYTFERGNYNFTLYDIINKEFVINKGSKISWLGDPYSATLNINAGYRQLVSFAPIISNQDPNVVNAPQMKRKYPCEVLLKLDGPLTSPQINFDIAADDLPNSVPITTTTGQSYTVALNNDFKAFKSQLANEQELKKQVFSLIMLRRFSPQDAFATLGGSGLYNSVSELLSNQLSYWLTQVDQNLEVNFDLGNFDQEAFNTFQLRLSYSFLNGRLRVTRDGAFNNQYNRSDVSNMLGDWTVDYLLTPDGTLKVKMFNRTNVNQLTSTFGGQTAISTGFSLASTKSFNSWKELLSSAHQRRRKEVEQEQQKKNKTN